MFERRLPNRIARDGLEWTAEQVTEATRQSSRSTDDVTRIEQDYRQRIEQLSTVIEDILQALAERDDTDR